MRLIGLVLFALIQGVLSVKKRKLQWVPAGILVTGLAVCAVIYWAETGSASPSVVTENRYFAVFMAENLIIGVIGCALGHWLARWRQ